MCGKRGRNVEPTWPGRCRIIYCASVSWESTSIPAVESGCGVANYIRVRIADYGDIHEESRLLEQKKG